MVTRSAKPRRRARGGERGATMFIVLMVLMILSAIGTFALSTARYEVQTSGFRRQRAQALEAANFGGFAAEGALDPARAAWYVQQLYKGEVCKMNAGVDVTKLGGGVPACYHMYPADIEGVSGFASSGERLFQMPGTMGYAEGSYGVQPLNGGFVVELTEPAELQRPVAGWGTDPNQNTVRFVDLTVTSMGVVFRDDYGTGPDYVIEPDERASATYANARGHVVLGPLTN